ncbi:hypothetical protein CZ674_01885 [Agrococcus casei LMG 22410]|uniref:Uncharacterized protein n=1 Tax=Agrococcus casei LMG 22410 TaxID=1255656 RepID=A0A1R4EZZ4_9MICO|nr:hypothetical protein CZ674_01885 [Agrococcus casei LMG 22410]
MPRHPQPCRDAGHGEMVDDDPGESPSQSTAGDLRPRRRSPRGVFPPSPPAVITPEPAHPEQERRGPVAERRVREPPDDRVPDHPFGTAFPAPRVWLGDAALDHRALRLESLADGLKAEFVEAAESGQARCGEGSVEQRRGLSDGQLRNFHPGRPRHLSGDRRAAPTYTLNCEEPFWLFADEGVAAECGVGASVPG